MTGHYQNFDGSSYPGFPLLANGDVPDIRRTLNIGGGDDAGAKTEFAGYNTEAHYDHEFVNNLKLSVKGKHSRSDLASKDVYAYQFGGVPASGDAYIYASLRENEFETYAGEIFLSKAFEALGQEHELLAGIDHRDQTQDFFNGYQYLGVDNIFDPDNAFQAPADSVLEAAASLPRQVKLEQTGVFTQAILRPLERLTLVAAGRHDWADSSNENTRTGVTLEESPSDFTGRAGAVFELFPWMNVYAGYAESFEPQVFTTTVDGSLLPPETGEQYEVGAKFDLFDGRLGITTALYRAYRQNVATQDPANPRFSIAVGEQRHQGFEFDLNGELWPGLNLTANFSFVDAEITKSNIPGMEGETPTRIPEDYTGRVFLTYELQSGLLKGLGFGGGAYFQSGFELSLPNDIKTDAYERVDAVMFYRYWENLDFAFNVRNLLDETYIESPGSINAYNSFARRGPCSPVCATGSSSRMRHFWTLVHRYAGLAIFVFLVVAGLTGSLLAFYHEIDAGLNPGLYEAKPSAAGAARLGGLALREHLQARLPDAWVHTAPLHQEPGEAAILQAQGAADPATGRATELENDEYFFDPYTGELLGARRWGDITQGLKNLMPFIYRLHYSLAIPGNWGVWLFGIAALIWTLDSFVGFYLTLPMRRRSARHSGRDRRNPDYRDVIPSAPSVALDSRQSLAGMTGGKAMNGRSFWQRWKPAWQVKLDSNFWRVNLDLHRAFGLWLWAMLFVFAWSSVAFNLPEVYSPITKALFDYRDHFAELPKLAEPQPEPGLDFRAAHRIARELAASEARVLGFVVERENYLQYRPEHGLFRYGVTSDRDIRDDGGSTQLWFDGNSGKLVKTVLPSGQHSGNTVTNWLLSLHMAQVWGLPFRIFVCVMGIAVAVLSVTGVVIWWRKRRARVRRMAQDPILQALADQRHEATQG